MTAGSILELRLTITPHPDSDLPVTRMAAANSSSSKRALTESNGCLAGDSLPLPHIPEEIIAEIVLRLPVKSLLKFRCVSKSWFSLISSPEFIKTHLMISTKNNTDCHNRFLLGSSVPRPTVFSTFLLNPKIDECSSGDTMVFDYDFDETIRVIGSCNGLVCVALDDCSLVLWNPATRKSRKLRTPDEDTEFLEYGFGYDASNDDYKIVVSGQGYRNEEGYRTRMKVYSWRSDSWRDMDWPGGVIFDGPGVFVNGAIHWKAYHGKRIDWMVSALNVTTEACSGVEVPRRGSHQVNVVLGVVSGRHLCALYDYINHMEVWVMKEYGVQESWTLLALSPYYCGLWRGAYVRPKLLFVLENGGIMLSLGSDLIICKPRKCHEVHRLGDDVIEVEGVTYCESLLSPELDPLDRS